MLWLNHCDVVNTGVCKMAVAQPLIEDTFLLLNTDEVKIAPEIPLRCREIATDEAFYSLPAYIGGPYQVAGLKWTTHHPDNKQKNLPHIYTLTTINDPETGLPLAIMEASLISAMRTGAVTATAIKYLSSPHAQSLFCCGAGFQARQQLHGALYARPGLRDCFIWSRGKASAEALSAELQPQYTNCRFQAVDDTGLAKTADMVITATPAPEPYLDESDFKDGVLYLNVGFNEATPQAILSFDSIVGDNFGLGLKNSGQTLFRMLRKGVLPPEKLTALLEEVIRGEKQIRAGQNEKIMFNAFGLVAFDLVLARYAYDKARQNGIGTELALF